MLIYGLFLSIFIGVLSKLLTLIIPNIGSITLAIFLGIFIQNTFIKFFIKPFVAPLKKDYFEPGVQFTEKKLLPIAIMLLGVELNLSIFMKLGAISFLFIFLIMLITILSGFFLSKQLGFDKKFGILLGVGNAVCGSSAIAATAPVLKSNKESIGLSIASVNLMGAIGIFLMPFLAKLVYFKELQTGMLIGGTLQAVGQAVASGFSVSDSVGEVATLIKMGRVLMLGVVILILSFFFKENQNKEENKTSFLKRFPIPYFIVGFFLFSLIASFDLLPVKALNVLETTGDWLLLVSMAAIGLKIDLASLLKQGTKVFVFQVIISILQVGFAIGFLFLFY